MGAGTVTTPARQKGTVKIPKGNTGPEKRAPKRARKPNRPTAGTSSWDAWRRGQSTADSGPLKDVFFAFDRSELSEEARAVLKADSDWLKANASARVQIEGHCDERGAEDYNMALGAKRAQAAMDYLTTLGITASRMSTVSFGEEAPVCREHTEACWAKNRRARFVIASEQPAS